MFRTRAERVSGWEAALPAEVLRLPEELARVDALLDDPAFFAPFAPFFDPRMGRPSTPMETYLRLMFLKFRYRFVFSTDFIYANIVALVCFIWIGMVKKFLI